MIAWVRWRGHVERKDDADYVKACTRLVMEGKAPVGRPRKTWQNTMSIDMRLLKVDTRRPRPNEMEGYGTRVVTIRYPHDRYLLVFAKWARQ